jgi:tRNA-splicing ligase RtcB
MQGIVSRVDKGTLDEAPFAYKEIDAVIAAQDGVVIKVIDHLQPLINVKG